MIHPRPGGVDIDVRVIPRAGRTGLAGIRDGRLLVRLAAAPVEGAANAALVDLFSTLFARPKRDIRVVSGDRSRSKRIAVDGVSADEAARVLVP